MIAAFLLAQLEEANSITSKRLSIWGRYHEAFATLEQRELCRRPIVPQECEHNAHMYYLLLPESVRRDDIMARLKEEGIGAIFHYIPLHSAPGGLRYARVGSTMDNTDDLSARIIRLPLWAGMTDNEVDRVIEGVKLIIESL